MRTGLFEIKCNIGKAGFYEFAKENMQVAKRISPCMLLKEDDFTSFQVSEEDRDIFLKFLDDRNVYYLIEEVPPVVLKFE